MERCWESDNVIETWMVMKMSCGKRQEVTPFTWLIIMIVWKWWAMIANGWWWRNFTWEGPVPFMPMISRRMNSHCGMQNIKMACQEEAQESCFMGSVWAFKVCASRTRRKRVNYLFTSPKEASLLLGLTTTKYVLHARNVNWCSEFSY